MKKGKYLYNIGEVAKMVGCTVQAVYQWAEFYDIPYHKRNRYNCFTRDKVLLIRTIYNMIHKEGYTMIGARKRIKFLGMTDEF